MTIRPVQGHFVDGDFVSSSGQKVTKGDFSTGVFACVKHFVVGLLSWRHPDDGAIARIFHNARTASVEVSIGGKAQRIYIPIDRSFDFKIGRNIGGIEKAGKLFADALLKKKEWPVQKELPVGWSPELQKAFREAQTVFPNIKEHVEELDLEKEHTDLKKFLVYEEWRDMSDRPLNELIDLAQRLSGVSNRHGFKVEGEKLHQLARLIRRERESLKK
jgi:hypothetical protein